MHAPRGDCPCDLLQRGVVCVNMRRFVCEDLADMGYQCKQFTHHLIARCW